ncbi:LAFE_0G11012g1_1 [Lachancea fermentati]|uniref:LAFE_0G11012g1_1 n=1 Tax=Lachancea fermentati TaxID=4955 RepID=A0A1G4MHY3_LACFM|nr:LAFE_0G11012g1_1 [Lachancea fermentati]
MARKEIAKAIALNSIASSILLTFGGCCSNVFTLESIVHGSRGNIGNIVTFSQFLFVSLNGLPHFIDTSNPPSFLKRRNVPLRVYVFSVLLFYVGSATNNSVFMYNVSVPLHIVFRCSATVITMLLGWLLAGKRYNRPQIISAVLLTLGAGITSLYRTEEFSWESLATYSMLRDDISVDWSFFKGVMILTFSSILLSLYSLFNEWSLRRYGKHWRENIFYTHFLALPFFLLGYKELRNEFQDLLNDTATTRVPLLDLHIPRSFLMLAANVVTQHFCVKGVNVLASQTSALNVSILLLIRKFTSLLLSIYIFGNKLSKTGFVGCILVFTGALLYSRSTRLTSTPEVIPKVKKHI